MVDGSTVRKNGEGEDSSGRLVLLFLKVSCTVSGVCQILFNIRYSLVGVGLSNRM